MNERSAKMPLTKKKSTIIVFPLTVFETAETKEDLEDWLLAHNPEFIKKMHKARKDDMHDKGRDWVDLKKELCLR